MSQKCHSLVIASSLIALAFLLVPTNSQTIKFTIEPSVGTISLHPMFNITIRCHVNSISPSYKPQWTLYFPDNESYLTTHDERDKIKLADHGIRYYSDEISTNITIPGSMVNNGTEVWCTILYNGVTEFSDQITLNIAGPPSSPDPVLKVLSPSRLQIKWEIPYLHENSAIERYNIQILNTTSGSKLEYSVMQNKFEFPTEDGNEVEHCHWLLFNVTAVSELGQSIPGRVSGGFPIAPKSFPSDVDVAVTFYGNGTPIAKVSFEAPLICDYQTLNYTITIEDITTNLRLPLLTHQSTYTGGSRMISKTFDTELLANHIYTLTVATKDSIFVDDVSAAVNFSTTFYPAHPNNSPDVSSCLHLRDIAIFAGGVFAVFLMTVMIIVIVIVCSRKRRLKKAPGSTMDLMLNSINRSRANGQRSGSQYDTPSKSAYGSALYEAIDGYQKQTPSVKAIISPWQQEECLRRLQQRNFESERSGHTMEADISYEEMHSASGHHPNQMMMHQEPRKPKNSHNKASAAFQVESHAAAAAGITLNPISTSHSDPDIDFPHSQSFDDHISTVAVVNEHVGNAEDDQSEYTFMSQAGTLAGQQNKLTLCTNGCINMEKSEVPMHGNVDITDKI